MKPHNFGLVGAAGYIAPRHLQAIRDTGNQLVCALDVSDSVGILDRYFADVDFFTEFERFDRHVGLLRKRRPERALDYVSICTPNFLHDSHIRFALRNEADAVCEKPLVLNPWNLDALEEDEQETGRKVYNILQLRVHPSILKLKQRYTNNSKRHQIEMTYITGRGNWYHYSWKGDVQKSGGVSTNIGIHFFDMLMWLFGPAQRSVVHLSDARKTAGFLELKNADVRWYLSVDKSDLPQSAVDQGKSTFRCIKVDDEEIEFSGGFTDLHTLVYQDILAGRGYGLQAARPSIELAYEIRNAEAQKGNMDEWHHLIQSPAD
mgnify:CR=1 FL=1